MGAFTQAYGEKDLDAASLLLERCEFISSDDPKYVSTVMVTRKRFEREGLMYRYRNHDDFGVPKSSFTVCSFWLIRGLWKIGKRREAEAQFEKMLGYRNHLGLLSEDIDFKAKRLLGNYPQGYSHLSLVDAAITLAAAEDDGTSYRKDFLPDGL